MGVLGEIGGLGGFGKFILSVNITAVNDGGFGAGGFYDMRKGGGQGGF